MKRLKQIFAVILALAVLMSAVPFSTILVSAEETEYTEGNFTYAISSENTAILTGYTETLNGDVMIPSTLGGYTVTEIDWLAFQDCDSLTGVTIPDSVTVIGNGAFSDCSNLADVTLPDSVTIIGGYAFSDCTSLSHVTLPNQITEIAWDLFSGCSNLTSVILPNGITTIGVRAFSDCTNLVDITIPDGVTTIGEDAFSGCTNLADITIPENVTEIAWSAFEDCTSLTNITIPDSVTTIGNSAFSGCIGLESITIPSSVNQIKEEAFANCSGLQSITVSADNSVFHSIDNCLVETESKTLVLGCQNSVIPSDGSVTEIGYGAFEGCTDLMAITIPDTVTTLGEDAFRGCAGLTELIIPDSVTEIGGGVFSGCSGLTDIVIPDGATLDSEFCFSGCSGLKSVKLPNGMTEFGQYMFRNCASLENIIIPDTVTTIGWYAFSGCNSLKSIKVSDKVTMINEGAFDGCGGVTSITVSANNSVYHSQGNCLIETESKTLLRGCQNSVIPDDGSVIAIHGDAFTGCTGLSSIVIPNSIVEIDVTAFWDCTNLKNITVLEGNPVYHSRGNCLIETESKTLLLGCQNSVIPDDGSTIKIGEWAFSKCAGLTNIVIPACISEIAHYAFHECTGLTSITIPDSVTSIGWNAFYGCVNLKSVHYRGTREQWEQISVSTDNDYLLSADITFAVRLASQNVTVESSTDVIDEDTVLFVEEKNIDGIGVTNTSNYNLDTAIAYDIYLMQEGVAVQPSGQVTVSIPVPADMDGERCKVFHVDEDGNLIDMNAQFIDGYLVFQTDHFSYYAIMEENTTLIGDINSDGVVNAKDVANLRRYLAGGWEVTIDEAAADVNGDDTINAKDVANLRRYLAGGWDVTLG